MARHFHGLALLTCIVVASASCAQRESEDFDSLRRQVEALEKKVSDLQPMDMTEFNGELVLAGTGGSCKLQSKSVENPKLKDGQWAYWSVTNNCQRDARVNIKLQGRDNGNKSKTEDPLISAFSDPIEPGETGYVTWKVKTKSQLGIGPGERGRDKWRFAWRVNNAVQQDPELEVEY